MNSINRNPRASAFAQVMGLCALAAALAACTKQIDAAQAQNINGLIYKLHESEPFTGEITNVNPRIFPGILGMGACVVPYKEGKRHGKTECTSETGRQLAEIEWAFGEKDGLERLWDPSTGNLRAEFNWKKGKRHGSRKLYNPANKMLIASSEWLNGELSGRDQVWDVTSGDLIVDLVWKNGEKTGFAKGNWHEENYRDGKRHGVQRFYGFAAPAPDLQEKILSTNALIAQLGGGGFFYGSLPGARVEKESIFEDGEEVARPIDMVFGKPTSPAGASAADAKIESCVEKWTAAHRKEVGEDAPIRMDLINEWEGWCKQGKLPG